MLVQIDAMPEPGIARSSEQFEDRTTTYAGTPFAASTPAVAGSTVAAGLSPSPVAA